MKKGKIIIIVLVIVLLYVFVSEIIKELLLYNESIEEDLFNDFIYTITVPSSKDSITIASFNIQTFGKSKREKTRVMNILANILCKFDIMAIQEIRDKTETTIEYYVNLSNYVCNNSYRDYIISPQIGRSSYKENYAFIYNPKKVAYVPESSYVYQDIEDYFEREPFIAQFKANEFDFILVNIHIKPDNAESEIRKLTEVIIDIKTKFVEEEDIIILGDLNADCSYYDENKEKVFLNDKEYKWLIPNNADTTTKSTNCTYDRIIISSESVEDYAGHKGVFMFDKVYDISYELTIEVSDHYPVWARFHTNKDTK
ncbi:MAG: endonuclease/exonuclease/phosphatase family protein [Nanoarchaeota archaeon]|nr:endonuclease/exonuclease/phosphatase family protein [DPANN group archaeon]MBL7116373.1 endonuclease/exonuclease/phosphatase family protein [Nanoarchaeota archaeon]